MNNVSIVVVDVVVIMVVVPVVEVTALEVVAVAVVDRSVVGTFLPNKFATCRCSVKKISSKKYLSRIAPARSHPTVGAAITKPQLYQPSNSIEVIIASSQNYRCNSTTKIVTIISISVDISTVFS